MMRLAVVALALVIFGAIDSSMADELPTSDKYGPICAFSDEHSNGSIRVRHCDDLDEAMSICDRHLNGPSAQCSGLQRSCLPQATYQQNWEACEKVERRWRKIWEGEGAKDYIDFLKKENKDMDFVKKIAEDK